MEILSLLSVLATVALPVLLWSRVPLQVPTHYDFFGQPDTWGTRNMIWVVVGVAIFEYALLTIVARYPRLHNYPWAVTAGNREVLYAWSRRLLSTLKLQLQLSFLYMVLCMMRARPLGAWFLPLVLGILALTLVVYFREGRKLVRRVQ